MTPRFSGQHLGPAVYTFAFSAKYFYLVVFMAMYRQTDKYSTTTMVVQVLLQHCPKRVSFAQGATCMSLGRVLDDRRCMFEPGPDHVLCSGTALFHTCLIIKRTTTTTKVRTTKHKVLTCLIQEKRKGKMSRLFEYMTSQ